MMAQDWIDLDFSSLVDLPEIILSSSSNSSNDESEKEYDSDSVQIAKR